MAAAAQAGTSASSSRRRPSSRTCRSPTTSASGCRSRAARRRPSRRGSTRCWRWSSWPATARGCRHSCPAASSSGWRWPACWPPTRRVLLFDEPLSALDKNLRDTLKYSILDLQRRTRKTAIYVTHDQSEAFAISDRIVVMNAGRIEQIGTQTDIYLHPRDAARGRVHRRQQRAGGHRHRRPKAPATRRASSVAAAGELAALPRPDRVRAGRRPCSPTCGRRTSWCSTTATARTYENIVEGKIDRVIFEGPTAQLRVDVGGRELRADVERQAAPDAGRSATARSASGSTTSRSSESRRHDSRPQRAAHVTGPRRPRPAASRPSSGASSSRSCPVRPSAVPRRHDGRPVAAVRGALSRHLGGRPSRDDARARRARGRHEELPECAQRHRAGRRTGLDVAKFFAWSTRLPLFQVPDRDDRQRAVRPSLRAAHRGKVRYLGWAVPRGGLRRFRRHPVGAAGRSTAPASATSCATTRPTSTGGW